MHLILAFIIAFPWLNHIINPLQVEHLRKKKPFIELTETTFLFNDLVSNSQYNEFLDDLKTKKQLSLYKYCNYVTDTTERALAFNDPYEEFDHVYPGFKNYPATDITFDAAIQYCNWLTGQYRRTYPSKKINIRLPTEQEFDQGYSRFELTSYFMPSADFASSTTILSSYQVYEFLFEGKRKAFLVTRKNSQNEYEYTDYTDFSLSASHHTGFRYVLEYL
jgi:hypothetical protein